MDIDIQVKLRKQPYRGTPHPKMNKCPKNCTQLNHSHSFVYIVPPYNMTAICFYSTSFKRKRKQQQEEETQDKPKENTEGNIKNNS